MADERGSEDNAPMNDEKPITEQPIEAPPPEPQVQDPRRRLRELLAISERERSDAVWDEIISLEIELAPGNRASSPQADVGRRPEPGRRQDQGRRPEQQGRRQDSGPGAKPAKRFFKKHKRGPGTPTQR
jgi:hypothetical protein